MEYFLCRAMEVARMSLQQLDQLHHHERKVCLMPHEIQHLFGLPPLRDVYLIPEDEAAQARHNQRLRARFRELKLHPPGGDLSICDGEAVHRFDKRFRFELEQGNLDLVYSAGGRRSRLKEDL